MALFGSETPRIWTPPARPLTAETSLGFECIEFAEEILEVTLFPWQKWFLLHALELLPGGAEFRFRTVILGVARQAGKSTLMQVLALWRMYCDNAKLVIGTAQDLDTAKKLWFETVELAQGIQELNEQIGPNGVVRGAGDTALKLKSGSQYRVKAATRRGGRGFSGDLVLLDELREHHNWEAWSAVSKTTMARPRAQIYCPSNAGDTSSVVLRHLRRICLMAPDTIGVTEREVVQFGGPIIDDIDRDATEVADDSIGIFEWSAPPDMSIWDKDGWVAANPSLGYGFLTERAISSAARTDPEWEFRTEVLCQWRPTSAAGPFPGTKWLECLDAESEIAAGSPLSVAVDVSWDRSMAYIAVAGKSNKWTEPVHGVSVQRIHVEVMAFRAGSDWCVDWLAERIEKFAHVVVQPKGAPASTLLDPLVARLGADMVCELPGTDMGVAFGQFHDDVKDGVIAHLEQPLLDVAAAQARVRTFGDSRAVDRKASPVDASPLVAVMAARWGLDQIKERFVSAYAADDATVLMV